MERCECLPLNSKFTRKSVLVKTKPLNRQTVISINQLFKVLSTGTNTLPSALAATDQWPCRWRSAWTQPKTATLRFCKVVWRHYLGEVGKFYRTLRLIYPRHCTPISIKIGQHICWSYAYAQRYFSVFYAPRCIISNLCCWKFAHCLYEIVA